ncbi:MAG TPA: DUF3322 domain-containing protein [Chlorobaculum sp.]|nr:DUF3322 domain-containing protein [Chlorobaculum sp.]
MSWTTPANLKAQVQKLWNRGTLLAPMVEGESPFPLRLTLKGPDSRQLSDRFAEVRDWIAQLTAAAGPYRIVWRSINHRVLGNNDIPWEIWIDSPDDALDLIGKRRAASEFADMVALTREKEPDLLPWLSRRPLRALDLAKAWPRILHLVAWLRRHPRPGIYPRQIDLPGVHSKFIESHRGVLSELFDLALPPESIDAEATGTAGFCQRYGFLDKPLRVRFRILDPTLSILATGPYHEITLTQDAFAGLDFTGEKVFITENEINFLAFPPVTGAMVIFGAGYGFRNLADIDWLRDKKLFYWGDIDTHGLAILNQLRESFPHAASLLMDSSTLLTYRSSWQTEPSPVTATLSRLTDEERLLYDQLRQGHWGKNIRLEQEIIGFETLREALVKL